MPFAPPICLYFEWSQLWNCQLSQDSRLFYCDPITLLVFVIKPLGVFSSVAFGNSLLLAFLQTASAHPRPSFVQACAGERSQRSSTATALRVKKPAATHVPTGAAGSTPSGQGRSSAATAEAGQVWTLQRAVEGRWDPGNTGGPVLPP